MWTKIIELVIAWLKERPRADLVTKMIALRDAMGGCHEAYVRYATERDAGRDASQAYLNWRREFGGLETAMADVDEVMHIFGADARRSVQDYVVSEAEPSAEDGDTVANAAFRASGEVPSDPQGTTGRTDFPEALEKLDAFIRLTFRPEEIVAARQRLI